jgi:hypothetical protein
MTSVYAYPSIISIIVLAGQAWLGRWCLCQTFKELDSEKDKESEVGEIRKLINEEKSHVS